VTSLDAVLEVRGGLERHEARVDEAPVVPVPHEPARAGGPERGDGHAELPGGVEAERHDGVRDEAGDSRGRGVGVDPGEQREEVREAGGHGGVAERGDVLRGVGVGRREAVRDGVEAEPGHAVQRAAGAVQAPVVELGVDEGDLEATRVEELGELQHGRHVALRRVRHAHGVRPLPMIRRRRQ